MLSKNRRWTYLHIIEYVLCGCSDDDGGDCGVFILLLAEYYHFAAADLTHFNSVGKIDEKKDKKKVKYGNVQSQMR